MTEAQWLAATDPFRMLDHLGRKADVRKLRLFACACCRGVWNHLTDPRGRTAVEVMEAEADRPGSPFREDSHFPLQGAVGTARAAARSAGKSAALAARHALHVVLLAAEGVTLVPANEPLSEPVSAAHEAHEEARRAARGAGRLTAPRRTALKAQCALLRDLFGNPFRARPKVKKAWLTDTVLALARQMYESRDFGAMPILADALQDAGCDDDAILAHCRDPKQPHARGCRIVDLVLGKQ